MAKLYREIDASTAADLLEVGADVQYRCRGWAVDSWLERKFSAYLCLPDSVRANYADAVYRIEVQGEDEPSAS